MIIYLHNYMIMRNYGTWIEILFFTLKFTFIFFNFFIEAMCRILRKTECYNFLSFIFVQWPVTRKNILQNCKIAKNLIFLMLLHQKNCK